jgi:hypothetical protein
MTICLALMIAWRVGTVKWSQRGDERRKRVSGVNVSMRSHCIINSEDECMQWKGRELVSFLLEFPRKCNEGWEFRANGLELDIWPAAKPMLSTSTTGDDGSCLEEWELVEFPSGAEVGECIFAAGQGSQQEGLVLPRLGETGTSQRS